jgi:hypothetical protein
MNKIYAYLYFPNDNLSDKITSREQGEAFLEEIQMLIDRMDCEKEVELFFESTNKENFIQGIAILEEFQEIGNFGVANFQTTLDQLLYSSDVEDLETNYIFDEKALYRQWDINDNFALKAALPISLKDITERVLQDINARCLFLNIYDAFQWNRTIIPVFKDVYPEKEDLPKFVHIQFETNFEGLDNWLTDNCLKKNYNSNDNRHIENHPAYISGKSPIIGGIGGKKNLTNLVSYAIGDWREEKDLMNYDVINERFVWFEYDNTNNNSYHGYHLAIPKTHERDKSAEKRIPDRVKSLLKYRQILKHKKDNNTL